MARVRGAAPLTIALPKGRVLDEAIALFGEAGLDLSSVKDGSRRLAFDLPRAGLRVLVVRDADVPTYVDWGAAELGVAGRDVLLEHERDLYEPLDLGLGRCRMVVAAPLGPSRQGAHAQARYGTKFPRVTERWLAERGLVADVIRLSGSVELGPLVGLCDRIVDIVSSGETLRQHGLFEVETIFAVSARLVVNRAAMKLRGDEIRALVERLERAIGAREAAPRRRAAPPTRRLAGRGRS
jgi:ATP phosphoribosyltransferase